MTILVVEEVEVTIKYRRYYRIDSERSIPYAKKNDQTPTEIQDGDPREVVTYGMHRATNEECVLIEALKPPYKFDRIQEPKAGTPE